MNDLAQQSRIATVAARWVVTGGGPADQQQRLRELEAAAGDHDRFLSVLARAGVDALLAGVPAVPSAAVAEFIDAGSPDRAEQIRNRVFFATLELLDRSGNRLSMVA